MTGRIQDLTVNAQLLLYDLRDYPQSTKEEMGERLALSPSALNDALAQLQEHGLVDRL